MSDRTPFNKRLINARNFNNARDAVDYVHVLYNQETTKLVSAFDAIASKQKLKDIETAHYPAIGFEINVENLKIDGRQSYGLAQEAGLYYTTLTRPDLFDSYYVEQLDKLIQNHGIEIMIGESDWSIPLPYVVDQSAVSLTPKQMQRIKEGFALPNLSRIDDTVANGTYRKGLHWKEFKPLSLFTGERVDYSLQRLHHYTGTLPKHFQSFILLTNYQRYMDPFIAYAKDLIDKDDNYTALIGPQNYLIYGEDVHETSEDAPVHLPQMPAYHLKRKDGQGISFINIGVGPSNAKTITDHLAVLRPHCWVMVGHCAGLRESQELGDYVLAHAYVREDRVLDKLIEPWVQIPAIAEVQMALQDAASSVQKVGKNQIKESLRTGTVLTTDNRNWELESVEMYERIQQSRSIAVDMESATIAANGFRFRVPYGTLLCVSDKPIHGEIKLQGVANEFYKKRVLQHLQVGLEAINLLRLGGVDQLHSRKLRGFDEPPFR